MSSVMGASTACSIYISGLLADPSATGEREHSSRLRPEYESRLGGHGQADFRGILRALGEPPAGRAQFVLGGGGLGRGSCGQKRRCRQQPSEPTAGKLFHNQPASRLSGRVKGAYGTPILPGAGKPLHAELHIHAHYNTMAHATYASDFRRSFIHGGGGAGG